MERNARKSTQPFNFSEKAYSLALEHQHCGSRLNKAFQKAFNVAKQIRTETNIQRGSVSVGSVAVELAEKIFTTLSGRQVDSLAPVVRFQDSGEVIRQGVAHDATDLGFVIDDESGASGHRTNYRTSFVQVRFMPRLGVITPDGR